MAVFRQQIRDGGTEAAATENRNRLLCGHKKIRLEPSDLAMPHYTEHDGGGQ
jgi:hypothetical protein